MKSRASALKESAIPEAGQLGMQLDTCMTSGTGSLSPTYFASSKSFFKCGLLTGQPPRP